MVESTGVVAATSRSSSPRSPPLLLSSPGNRATITNYRCCRAVQARTIADTNHPAIFPPGEDDVWRAVNTVAVSGVASPHMRLCPATLILPHITTFLTITTAVKFVDTDGDGDLDHCGPFKRFCPVSHLLISLAFNFDAVL